jgi:hypothetical protein
MALKVVATIGLRVGERKPYGVDLTKFCAHSFSPGEIDDLAEIVRPLEEDAGGKGPTGLQYRVTTAGQCANREPTWPTAAAQTVTCGTVVFTAEAISNASLKKTITASAWTGPATILIEDEATETSDGEQKTAAFIEATEAFSTPIEIVNHVTFSDGHEEYFAIKVSKAV